MSITAMEVYAVRPNDMKSIRGGFLSKPPLMYELT